MAVEIDEGELATLRRAAGLLGKLNTNPKARQHLERAVKEEYPEVQTEEEQITRYATPYVEKLESKFSDFQKTITERFDREDKARQEAADRRGEDELRSSLQRVKKAYSLTDEGIGKVVELMVERKIADPEAAAAYYERMNPAPAQVASAWEPQTWKVADDNAGGPTTKDWFMDPEGTSDRVIGDTLREIRTNAA